MKNREPLEGEVRRLFKYFHDACRRIEVMDKTPAADEDNEQAAYAILDSMILSCCYLDALSVFRFGELNNGENFIRFLQEYTDSDHRAHYRKVSCLYLDQPPLNKKGKTNPKQFRHGETAKIRKILYGANPPDIGKDISIDEALTHLNNAGLDVTKGELNRFSYAAYFYERYRCYGVHHVQPLTPDISGRSEPYYAESPKRLVFPPKFVLDTLSTVIENFESEVVRKFIEGERNSFQNSYQWFKETYKVESRFIETVISYYKYGMVEVH